MTEIIRPFSSLAVEALSKESLSLKTLPDRANYGCQFVNVALYRLVLRLHEYSSVHSRLLLASAYLRRLVLVLPLL